MSATMTGMALAAIVVVPLVLSPVAWACGTRWDRAPRLVAAVGALVQTMAALAVAVPQLSGGAVERVAAGSHVTWWLLLMDGLSRPFVVLTALVGAAAVSASWKVTRRPGAHFALLLALQSAVATVFLADDLLLFYVAWEAVLIPMFLLIGGWGSSNARAAATKFLVFTFAGGAVLLVGVVAAWTSTGSTSIAEISQLGGVPVAQSAVFWLLAIGMLVKLPAVPLHSWLPDAHTEAPAAGSIVLAGVLLKMGGYGLIRIAVPFAPAAMEGAGVVLVVLGAIGIIWGAASALVQTDLKRLVAYSSVAHMGFVAVAVGLNTPASLSAAVVTMVSHGFVAGLLFFLVGALYERAHTRELTRFGGLGSTARGWSVAFVFASLASAGLPGLSGFPGEFVTALETYAAYGWWVLALGVGVVLAAAYNLRAVRATVQGPVGESGDVGDLDPRERATALLFAVSIVAVGVAPWLLTNGLATVFSAATVLGGGG